MEVSCTVSDSWQPDSANCLIANADNPMCQFLLTPVIVTQLVVSNWIGAHSLNNLQLV